MRDKSLYFFFFLYIWTEMKGLYIKWEGWIESWFLKTRFWAHTTYIYIYIKSGHWVYTFAIQVLPRFQVLQQNDKNKEYNNYCKFFFFLLHKKNKRKTIRTKKKKKLFPRGYKRLTSWTTIDNFTRSLKRRYSLVTTHTGEKKLFLWIGWLKGNTANSFISRVEYFNIYILSA